TGLQATLTRTGVTAMPAVYAITAGAVSAATVAVDQDSYVSGSDIQVTVTLKDAQGNAVSGQASSLKDAV
ncbi:hypothetical protein, partial [Serratia marcescens]|uniref:hypothetical protein n=1 Tax=Serratia marcescens TaxID=615 RepID=UPI0027E5A829